MNCASCGRANRDGARFCGGCGGSLAPRCPACGAASEPDARFCDACGAPIAGRPPEASVQRKVVTIVFADLIGSTALHERLDPESVRRIMEGYHGSVRAPIEAHGGTVVQLLGDGVMCAFGIPRVAEDDALRAVRAALDVQCAFRTFVGEHPELAGRVGLRVAVNTGEVVVSDDYAAGIGDPLNVAARLQQEAKDGDVLIGGATQRIVAEQVTLEPIGSFALKGRAEPVAAYRVVSLEAPERATATPFVGRDAELRRLTAVYEAAVAAPAARLALLLGSPGLGKSRLLAELAHRLGDLATVLSAQCVASVGATFAPLADALRSALDAAPHGEPSERARIEAGIGALLAGTPAAPEETFFVVRRLLAALATKRPVVLVIDDLQWAEPLLLDLTEHMVQWGAGVPLLVLAAARPELRDVRSSLTSAGGVVSEVVTLGGLDAGAATQLAASVIGGAELPAAIASRVLATSEGNPLFLGELVRMLVNDGALRKEGERWKVGVELAALEMPPTIQALLAARIERLRAEDRLVLERASVIGRQFSRTALAHLLPSDALADLDARLESLRRSELIEPDAGWLLGEPMLRFHHVLIRDAAYRRLLRNARAELHTRFAEWLEGKTSETAAHEETLGWHLEQAHRHLNEIGPLDAPGRALGERAARYLASAGRRALARDDLPPAGNLLGRALACLDTADPARAELALDWCEALLSAGDVVPAARALEELERFAGGSERLRAWHTCFSGQLKVLSDPQALRTSIEAVAAAAETLASAGDAAGEAKAHWVHAIALSRLGQVGACEAALDRALAAARRVRGDRRRANAVLSGAPLAALWGPSPVARASGRCLDVVRVLRITQGAPAVEAVALRCQGVLETLRGRGDAARRMLAASRRMVEELGITQRVLEADLFAGLIELLEGDAASAERHLRTAYEGLRAGGLGIDAAQAAALLGRALLAQDRAAEAEALSHESEALAGDDLKAAIAWRGVRAEALARRGQPEAAIELARHAVEIAAATDALLDHADARQALAAALRAVGRSAEAEAEEQRAIELWDAKGATLLVERARGGAGDGAQPARPQSDAGARAPGALRRVCPNEVTVVAARLEAAVAARDGAALPALLADSYEMVDHAFGATYGHADALSSFHALLRGRDPTFRFEPLASLGDSLALLRRRVSSGGTGGGNLDVGAYEMDEIIVNEVEHPGCFSRGETFATDKLGDAIARLYERYAELLPTGPEQTRAATTARAVAVLVGPLYVGAIEPILAPEIEFVDHRRLGFEATRGAAASLDMLRTLAELSPDATLRVDEVLVLEPGALLLRCTNAGTERTGGGAFERPFHALRIFGADGRLARLELFDVERAAEALARYDELSGARPAQRIARRVCPNAGTAHVARLNAAIAARDADVLPALHSDGVQVVHHPTGVTLDRQETLAWWRALFAEDRDFSFRLEPVATLGDSLALCRHRWSGSASRGAGFDVGAFQRDTFTLIEGDAQGRQERVEVFAADRLGDALARLYERYAELLPESPERTRAATTARAVAALLGWPDLERWRSVFGPDVEFIDSRSVGVGSIRGADAVLHGIRALFELSSEFATRIEDVLCAEPGALLVRWINSGTLRASGGEFERDLCHVWRFGADGRLVRWEQFDGAHSTDALARFDELAAPLRRVRPNAASAEGDRLSAAVAARDVAALEGFFSERVEIVEHPTGAVLDGGMMLSTWRSFLRAEAPALRNERLATLGDRLALVRSSMSFAALAAADASAVGSFGAVMREELVLIEVGADGRQRHLELFGLGQLGAATSRLYERYAELLPAGPARTRAAATAGSVGLLCGAYDPDALGTILAPDAEYVDRRPLGFGALRGADAIRRWIATLSESAVDVSFRLDDVIDLRSDRLLARWTNLGTERLGGGAFERSFIALDVFDRDGFLSCWEHFDADREHEALARCDELAGPRPTAAASSIQHRVRKNAATANAARMDAAVAARDLDALYAVFAETARSTHHPTATEYAVHEARNSFREMLAAEQLVFEHEPLASLGESLALHRGLVRFAAIETGAASIGAANMDSIVLGEVDARGLRSHTEFFATDKLGDAIARLYARYAELLPEGEARVHAAATARSAATMLGSLDADRNSAAVAPAVEFIDHRPVGLGSARGAEVYLRSLRVGAEIAVDIALRHDDVLELRPDLLLVDRIVSGVVRASGGAFENHYLCLWVFGGDGLVTRVELFAADRVDDAFARCDELAAAPGAPGIENAATRWAARFNEAWATGDWERVAALYPPRFRQSDRRRMVQLELDRDEHQGRLRAFFEMSRSRCTTRVIATRGDRLALIRMEWSGADAGAGSSEIEFTAVLEMGGDGALERLVQFDPDALDTAYAELDACYAAGEGAAHPRMLTAMDAFRAAFARRDWEAVAAQYTPDVVVHDRRLLGWEPIRGAAVYVESLRTLVELSPDVHVRSDHIALNERGLLWVGGWSGSREGGPFDSPWIVVSEGDGPGRVRRFDTYDLEQLDAARARFAELGHDPLRIPPNAATRFDERLMAVIEAHDWEGAAALIAEDASFEDRRRGFRLSGGRDLLLTNMRYLGSRGVRSTATALATAGDRLALQRFLFTGSEGTAPFEVETLQVTELDDDGHLLAGIVFDLDDRRAASDEMFVRFRRGEGAAHVSPSFIEFVLAMNAHDRERARALLPDDFVFDDRRRTGVGRLGNADDYVASLAALWGESADANTETLYHVTFAEHGSLNVARMFGTLASGGEFESLFVRLGRFRGGQFVGAELFELEDLELARARFEELRPDPSRIPPNAAARAFDRVAEAFRAWDPAALRVLASADFHFEDRRRRALVSGDVELWIRNLEVVRSYPGLRTTLELIGTVGDRIALERLSFIGDPGGGAFEGEFLRLTEVDADGKIRAWVHFDPEDHGLAFVEAHERFAAHEAAGSPAQAVMSELVSAFTRHDREALRACFAPDARVHDRRTLGFGELGVEQWIESMQALSELAPDFRLEPFRILRWTEHGRVALTRICGTREGGPFEIVHVNVFVTEGGRIRGFERFDTSDAERALARFAELSAS